MEKIIEMTKQEAMNLLQASRRAFAEVTEYSFGEAVMDAEDLLEKIEKVLDKIKKPSKEYDEYQTQLSRLTLDNTTKQPDGTPKFVTTDNFGRGYYDIDPGKLSDFQAKKAALDKKSKKLIDEQTAKNENYNRALKEDVTYEPPEIVEKQLPKKLKVPDRRVARKLLKINKK